MKYKHKKKYRYVLEAEEDDVLNYGFIGQLGADFSGINISHEYFQIASVAKPKILVREGYAWDGATGPVFQTKSTKIASLVHDALLQAIDLGLLDKSYLKAADKLYRDIAIDKGMWRFRAHYHYWAMRYLRPLIWDKLPKKNYEKVYEV